MGRTRVRGGGELGLNGRKIFVRSVLRYWVTLFCRIMCLTHGGGILLVVMFNIFKLFLMFWLILMLEVLICFTLLRRLN
jgi:hypothetical protein